MPWVERESNAWARVQPGGIHGLVQADRGGDEEQSERESVKGDAGQHGNALVGGEEDVPEDSENQAGGENPLGSQRASQPRARTWRGFPWLEPSSSRHSCARTQDRGDGRVRRDGEKHRPTEWRRDRQ